MTRVKSFPASDGDLVGLKERYLSAIIKGDLFVATKLVLAAFEQGVEPIKIYLSVVCAAQSMLGELWSKRALSITEEHVATQISFSVISVLRERVTPKAARGMRCLVIVPSGDPHLFPGKVVADLFHFDGWEVTFPGSDIPDADLLSYITRLNIDLVAISATLPPNETFSAFLSKIKSLPDSPKIIVGGAAAGALVRSPDIDAFVSSIPEALSVAANLVGNRTRESSLDDFLQRLGENIHHIRKERVLNQHQLAALCGIDRAYLSGVENGKQNVTLGVVHKIASALGVPVSDLLNPM